jgi:hypothetical protein
LGAEKFVGNSLWLSGDGICASGGSAKHVSRSAGTDREELEEGTGRKKGD